MTTSNAPMAGPAPAPAHAASSLATPALVRGKPSMQEHRVREWVPSFLPIDAAVLAPLVAGSDKSFSIAPCPGGCRFVSQGVIGVVVLGAHVIRIEPKIPNLNVLAMIDYAERGVPWDETEPLAEASRDFASSLFDLFLLRAARLARQGWVRSYREREDDLANIRGRILVERQIRRSPASLARTDCRFEEFGLDVAPNRLVLCALQRIMGGASASGAAFSARLRMRARSLIAGLDEVTPSPDVTSAMRIAGSDRRFARYGSLLPLAQLIVRGGSFHGESHATASGGFLLDLAPIFEAAVGRAFQAKHRDARLQMVVPLDDRRTIEIKPDVVVMSDAGVPAFVADAKYKDPEHGTPRADDVEQLVTYLVRLGVERGALVFPGVTDASAPTLSVPAFDRRLSIEVRRVRVDSSPSDIASSFEAAAICAA